MLKECAACGRSTDKRCSGCYKVWYCSGSCQKSLWISHIFDCNPRKPIHTGHHLVLACQRDGFPDDVATCNDYGFTKASSPIYMTRLLALYVGLVVDQGVTATQLHKWRTTGTLVGEIKAAYNKLPEDSRGPFFEWFLENQYLLDDTLPPPDLPDNNMSIKGWRFIGGSISDTKEDIERISFSWPTHKKECYEFYKLCLMDWQPSPATIYWTHFGFCALWKCQTYRLALIYRLLINRCTFDAFCDAFEHSTLINLFDSNDMELLRSGIRYLDDVLGGSPYSFKSVWHLKNFVVSEEDEEAVLLEPSWRFEVDYGFVNCRSEQDRKDLKGIYRQILSRADANPLKLHEAALQGKLFEYVNDGSVRLKKKFRRLMKNPYT